jgi:ferric-dicitrate binding protein FerR (iron transport regulator)
MNSNISHKLLLKYLLNQANKNEKNIVNRWLREDPQNVTKLENLINSPQNPYLNVEDSDLEKSWERIIKKTRISLPYSAEVDFKSKPLSVKNRQYNSYRGSNVGFTKISFVSIILILLTIGSVLTYNFLIPNGSINSEVKFTSVKVDLGRQKQLILSDKSIIKLDAGSELKYPEKFEGNIREVFLNGTGLFEVSHNPEKPFIVHANGSTIKVLGTKFNIDAWSEFNKVDLTVIDGKVSFSNKVILDQGGVIVSKGEASTVRLSKPPSTPRKTDINKCTAWLNQELSLNKTELKEVIDKLTRWYGVNIVLPSEIYKKVQVSGEFKNKSVDQILKTIALMIDLKVEHRNNYYTFYKQNIN